MLTIDQNADEEPCPSAKATDAALNQTAFEAMKAALLEKTQILEFAMQNTDINLWYYDIHTRTCTLTENCKRVHSHDIDELPNFPESLFATGTVREDCVEAVRENCRRLCEDGLGFEMDIWYRKPDGSGWWCERTMMNPVLGADGKPTHAIGIGKNMTAIKELEEKYQAFQTYRKLAEKNTVASFRMNLTKNWCGDCVTDSAPVRNHYQTETVDGFFNIARARIATDEDLALCEQIFSRERLLEAFLRGETSKRLEYRYQSASGRVIWLRTAVEMIRNPVTNDVEALLYSFDIDYEKNMGFIVDKLLTTDYEFLGLLDTKTGYLLVFGDNKNTDGMARNGSYYDEEMPHVFRSLIPDAYLNEGIQVMQRAHIIEELGRHGSFTCSFPAKSLGRISAGRKQWKFSYLDSTKAQILMTRADITDVYAAERDDLTGLYNRPAFYRQTRTVLDANPGLRFVLLRCDIDRFKAYNDACGTQAGDELLAEFGRAIRYKSWPELAVFGRLEADHFCALFPLEQLDVTAWGAAHTAWLARIAPDYRLTSSVGIYEITEPKIDVSLMCDRAFLALRTVKDSYVNKIAWYTDSLRQKLMEEQSLADDMERALREEQFVLYFQPQVNYDDGAVVGAEVLVRWLHPKRGLILPGEFIPLFEKNGFIRKLDAYVWERSCQYLREWLDSGIQDTLVPVSVNISRCDIYDPALCETLRGLIEKYRIPASLLKLEITESAYMENPEQLLETVRELQRIGFTVEMDDFGAGYSSLNTLKDVPVDILKLDVRFLSGGQDDVRGGLILSSVIRMARWLKLPVIAEGVEERSQADYLKSLSCFYMQGYHFAHPMPVDDYLAFLLQQQPGKIDRYTDAGLGGVDSLWDPAAQSSLLFNSFVGGAAILEYDGENAEILRANDKFYQELGTTRSRYLEAQQHTLDRFEGEHREAYRAMLREAIHTGGEAECSVQSLPHTQGGAPFWTHNCVRVLTRGQDNRYLLYLTVENITARFAAFVHKSSS